MPQRRRIGLSLEILRLFKQHTDVFAGVLRYADEAGWRTTVDDWIESKLVNGTRGDAPYDGVIARVDRHRIGLVEAAARAGVPLVNVFTDSQVFDRLPGAFLDFHQVGQLQAEHLMSLGLRRYAAATIAKSRPDGRQSTAFTARVQAAGHAVTVLELPRNWNDTLALAKKHRARIEAWIDSWKLPIGVACSVDLLARELAQICHERGWRIPEDVAIMGGRNEERLCEKPRPGISSVDVGFDRVGYEAARLLDRLMEEPPETRQSMKPEHVILPPIGVVVRESTNHFMAEDELVVQAQAYIAKSCHMHLEVSDVAEALSVSTKTLQNRFAAELKRSVAQEIRRARVEKAKHDLAHGDLSMHEIAIRAGFTSNKRMSEVFRRDVGMTPSDYRDHRKVKRER
jgi:LacI family transcriptional regulator